MDRESAAEDGCGEERWVGVAPGLADGVAMSIEVYGAAEWRV